MHQIYTLASKFEIYTLGKKKKKDRAHRKDLSSSIIENRKIIFSIRAEILNSRIFVNGQRGGEEEEEERKIDILFKIKNLQIIQ